LDNPNSWNKLQQQKEVEPQGGDINGDSFVFYTPHGGEGRKPGVQNEIAEPDSHSAL